MGGAILGGAIILGAGGFAVFARGRDLTHAFLLFFIYTLFYNL
jgi:hypothetical protein